MAKCSLFGNNFVLKAATPDIVNVRCPEQSGGRFSEVCFKLLAYYNQSVLQRCPWEVVRFWEGPLREAPSYIYTVDAIITAPPVAHMNYF